MSSEPNAPQNDNQSGNDFETEEQRSYDDYIGMGPSFFEDPWPKTVLLLTIIGLGIVLLTPVDVWSAWNYTLLGTYGLMIIASVGTVIGLRIWFMTEGSRLKYGGIANAMIVIACAAVGTLDSIFWIGLGRSFVPQLSDAPILSYMLLIQVMSLYSIYLLRRTIQGED